MIVHSHKLISTIDMPTPLLTANSCVDLVFVNGPPLSVSDPALLDQLKKAYPEAHILGCSSAGEMLNGESSQNTIIVSAIEFEHTNVKPARVEITENSEDEFESGKMLAKQLKGNDLQMIILFSEGLAVDCDELVNGICHILGPQAPIFGGLAGDIKAFEYTLIMDRQGVYDNGVVAVGLYSDRLKINTAASICTQDGEEIEITSAQDNIIYAINDQPALDMYDDLITDQSGLALSSRLYFPLVILDPKTQEPLYFRTVHEYHIESKSILAAGTVPVGPAKIINMTNSKHILEDTRATSAKLKESQSEFALIVSCAGRRATMSHGWLRESSIIKRNLGGVPQHGFYSLGEIGKSHYDNSTILHNHTLSIATFHES